MALTCLERTVDTGTVVEALRRNRPPGSKGAVLRRAWGPEKRFRSLLHPPERRIEHYYREETKPGPRPEVPRWPVQN